jgi:nitrogen fixation protein NifU and related proteins
MADLRDMYQEVILEHAKSPRNFRALPRPSGKAEGYNPLCGDRCTVFIDTKDGVINDISFEGSGCAISRASASMMTQSLKGKTLEQAEQMFHSFHDLVTGQKNPDSPETDIGKLKVFAGVSEFPARVKCATLAWHTLQAALHGASASVTTE